MTISAPSPRFVTGLVGSALLLVAAPTFAQDAPVAPVAGEPAPATQPAAAPSAEPAPAVSAAPAPAPAPASSLPASETLPAPVAASPAPRGDSAPPDFTAAEAESARFSGGRLVVGILGSAVGGSAAAYGTYKGICGDDPCVGGALAGLGANLVVTPLLSYGIGRLMGGRGTFGSVLLGAAIGFGAGAPFMANSNAGLIVGLALMPIMGPLAFEFSSGAKAREMQMHLGSLRLSPYIAPPSSSRSTLRLPATYGFVGTF